MINNIQCIQVPWEKHVESTYLVYYWKWLKICSIWTVSTKEWQGMLHLKIYCFYWMGETSANRGRASIPHSKKYIWKRASHWRKQAAHTQFFFQNKLIHRKNEEIRCINSNGKMTKEWMRKWWLTFFKLYTLYI